MTFNTKHLTQLTTVLLSALLMACHSPEPATVTPDATIAAVQPPLTVTDGIVGIYRDYPLDPDVLVGDTTILKKVLKLHTPPANDPDLTALKNNDDPDLKGKPLRYVSVGGSLTAGVRDGGLYQDAQQTSFPNILARQMKLQSFKQPFFGDNEYNGYGYRTIGFNPFGTPVPYYNVVKNNTSIANTNKGIGSYSQSFTMVNLNKYIGGNNIDNFGVPFSSDGILGNPFVVPEAKQVPFYKRVNENQPTINSQLTSQKFDFFSLEVGTASFLETSLIGRGAGYVENFQGTTPYHQYFLEYAAKIKAKGFILNVPYVTDFPYFKIVSMDMLKKAAKTDVIFSNEALDANTQFLPTTAIDSLLNPRNTLKSKGLSPRNRLNNSDALTTDEIITTKGGIDIYNGELSKFGKKYNYPIVDLFSLYKKVIARIYVTDDGVKVDPTFPNGNFFSSDGVNPTPFGQAIIANEVIRTLNSFYKTSIQLINEDEYLKK